MKKLIIILFVLMIISTIPILLDSIYINSNHKPIFSNEAYYKPSSAFECFCLGQRFYDGPYYEIYHDSDTSPHGKTSNLIPILGTKCKFKLTSL